MRFDADQGTWSLPTRPAEVVPARRRGWLPVAAVRPDYELIELNGPRLEIGGRLRAPASGSICAVSYRAELRPSAREVIRHLVDPHASVVARSRLTGGRPVEEFEAAGLDDSTWSLDSATAAAAALLGRPVTESGNGASIEALREDTRGLRCDDVISAVNGSPVRSAVQLRAALAGLDAAQLTVLRIVDGKDQILPVAVRRHEDGAWGIRVITAGRILQHGLAASFNLPDDLRGPSLGLACALSIVDALTGGRLAAHGAVVATGTVDLAGRVGGVGAIEYKARAVRSHAHVRHFLVPADPAADVDAARRILGARAQVVAVATLAEAVEVLGGLGWRRAKGARRSRGSVMG